MSYYKMYVVKVVKISITVANYFLIKSYNRYITFDNDITRDSGGHLTPHYQNQPTVWPLGGNNKKTTYTLHMITHTSKRKILTLAFAVS